MYDTPDNSPSKYHHFFSQKLLHKGNKKVIIYTTSIWEDEHIHGLENNQWKCLWCNVIFHVINDTKALAHVIRTRGIHINSCFTDIDQSTV